MTKTLGFEYTQTQTYSKQQIDWSSVGVIVLAAGSASRMQGIDKITAELDGVPVIIRALRAFDNISEVKSIILVVRSEMVNALQNILDRFEISKVTDIVAGGASRAQSVKNGFEVLKKEKNIKTVLIHDGARPLVSEKVIKNVITATEEFSAAIPAVPVKDTVKKIGVLGKVEMTPDRSQLVLVQTPQGFSMECYRESLNKAGDNLDSFTDDSSLVENAGFKVYITEGDYKNIKITTPEDMMVAEVFARFERGV